MAGWERANWYAAPGEAQKYTYSWGRPPWFGAWEREHRAVRQGVGLFDLSSFGKLLVQGRDAAAVLQHVSTSDVDVEPGTIVYTQWLNERGGIEADVTITRWTEDTFMVMTAAATVVRDADWLRRNVGKGKFVAVTDVSAGYALLPVMGPRAPDLVASITDADVSDTAFPFGASKLIDLGMTYVRATRISYVGELGFELLVTADQAVHVYDTLTDAGEQFGLRHAGYHALNSLRLEKAYRSWGHDIGWGDSPLEAGLGFTIDWDKPAGFVGRDALANIRESGVRRRLVQFIIDDPDVMAYHQEPIYRDGQFVGVAASATYGHTLGRTVGLAWISSDDVIDAEWVKAGSYEIEVAATRYPITVSPIAMSRS